MKTYARREPHARDDAQRPATQAPSAFGDLPQVLNQSPKVQDQLRLDAALNQGSAVQRKAHDTGLPDDLKAGIEDLSGLSLDNVQVHYNSPAPAQLQALAYAQDTDIHLAPGQEEHLPHEAWHVVQQMQGRVRPTLQTQGVDVNDEPALEQEADRMGARAAAREAPVQRRSPAQVAVPRSRAVAQRVELGEVDRSKIKVTGDDNDFAATYDGQAAGTLELFEDPDGRRWINNVETLSAFQGKGIGLLLLEAAVAEHGALCASTASNKDHEGGTDVTGRDDTRHLSTEGAALVNSAIRNGIMQEDWLTDPFMTHHEEDSGQDLGEASEGEGMEPLLDLSGEDLPALPEQDFTWVVGYYNLEQAVDGSYLDFRGVSVHASLQEPIILDFSSEIWASSGDQILRSLASYYKIGEDHVKVVRMNGE